MTRLRIGIVLAVGLLLALAAPASASSRNSGFYDNQIIEYEATAQVTSSPQAAQQLAKGNIVFHVVDASGATPAVQCARLLTALPGEATACNVLNFIPTEVGYTGGAWNLQIFHWNAGQTPTSSRAMRTSRRLSPRARAPSRSPISSCAARP